MRLSKQFNSEDKMREHGRVIARGMNDIKVEQQKNMARAVKRKDTMLRNAAEVALSGK